uniref:DUF4371 domain-containing protein n=1 Tax=Octopus bimaculoides TaxID=37653 RepID=A0A0L8GFH7_OCTBM
MNAVGAGFHRIKVSLIRFCTDGASIVFTRKAGIVARLIQEFLNLVSWHCLSHRLQFVLADAINEINEISHIKIFFGLDLCYFFISPIIKVSLSLEPLLQNYIFEI